MSLSQGAPSGAHRFRASSVLAEQGRTKAKALAKTDVGRQREHNEDAFLVHAQCDLFAVFDGMGGNNAGEVASALGARSLRNFFEATEIDRPTWDNIDEDLSDDARRLITGIRKANADIFEISSTHLEHRGMGSTVVALHLGRDGLAHIAHVGDSRCYRIRDGVIEQLTRDHSLISDALAWNPNLTKEELARLPRNIISRALGLRRGVEIDLLSEPLLPGDLFLLCSDGLSGMLSDSQILEVVQLSDDLREICENLIALANEAGGSDNITALAIRVDSVPSSPLAKVGGRSTAPASPPDEEVTTSDSAIQTAVFILCPFCGGEPLADDSFCGACGAHLTP
jgi:serine/threonine protein phosphatase PrpC